MEPRQTRAEWVRSKGEGNRRLMKQLVSVAFTAVFACSMTFVILFVLKLIFGDLRVDEEAEALGLDLSEHSESAYVS